MNIKISGVTILGLVYDELELQDGKLEAFNLWAFGSPNILLVEFVPLWNKLHGAALFLNEDSIEIDFARMILKLWEGR